MKGVNIIFSTFHILTISFAIPIFPDSTVIVSVRFKALKHPTFPFTQTSYSDYYVFLTFFALFLLEKSLLLPKVFILVDTF